MLCSSVSGLFRDWQKVNVIVHACGCSRDHNVPPQVRPIATGPFTIKYPFMFPDHNPRNSQINFMNQERHLKYCRSRIMYRLRFCNKITKMFQGKQAATAKKSRGSALAFLIAIQRGGVRAEAGQTPPNCCSPLSFSLPSRPLLPSWST